MGFPLSIVVVAAATAVACAVPGVFLVLRRQALLTDAISHSVLLGIVIAFARSLHSPWLLVGAAGFGVLVVVLIEAIAGTGRVAGDAPIGLVFPALFSLGVILVSRNFRNVHLNQDAVLVGEITLTVFDQLTILGREVGPRAFYLMLAVASLNSAFVAVFHKELKVASFDPMLARTLGLAPRALHYLFMTLVSLTAVAAFEVVGSILVIALMIAPPASAYLLAASVGAMLGISMGIAAFSAVAGFAISYALDTAASGTMAAVVGLVFFAVFLFQPRRGLLARRRRRREARIEFAVGVLAGHLHHHEGGPAALRECSAAHLTEHIGWNEEFAREVLRRGERRGVVRRRGDLIALTDSGRRQAGLAQGR